MQVPRASRRPVFRASLTPAFRSLWITRTRLSAAAHASQRAGEPSVQPSSIRSSSQSPKVWAVTLFTQASRNASA